MAASGGGIPVSTALARAAPSIALAAALLAGSWDKAFTVDDPFFLEQAEQVLVDPLHPYDFEFAVRGERFAAPRVAVSGPGMAYLLVPAVWAGAREGWAHLSVFALLAIAAVAQVSLAARCGLTPRESACAGMLLVATPAVMGMGATFASSVVLALYIHSEQVAVVYSNPMVLSLVVPVMLFWQCRLWLSTARGQMEDDPIVYAAKDWVSHIVGWLLIGIAFSAHIF